MVTFINKKLLPLKMNSYHMMMATRRMIASLRLSKKSLRSWPCSFMLPIIRPKHMEKTTSPRALTPFTWPGTGIASSRVISMTSWVALVELKRVSFTVTVTWTTRLPYLVLNWRMKELQDHGCTTRVWQNGNRYYLTVSCPPGSSVLLGKKVSHSLKSPTQHFLSGTTRSVLWRGIFHPRLHQYNVA